MKLLFFMNHYPDSRNGGIENVTRILAEQLKINGYTIHLRYLYESKFDHTDDSIFVSCKRIGLETIEAEIKSMIEESGIDIIINRCVLFASPIIRQAISTTKCILITTYNNKPTISPRRIKSIWNDNSINFIKKILITTLYPIYSRRSKRRLIQLHQNSYIASDATVLLSKNYIDEYADLYGVSKEKIAIINNPIKYNQLSPTIDLKSKEKIILMVTRLDEEQKCIIKALKIWENVSRSKPDWRLLIIGNGPDEERIKTYAKLHYINNIEFLPACDPTPYYRKASIFLMTSKNEGWPNTLNEAMYYGCVPIVLGTFSAVYDIIDNDINGFIIQANDENQDTVNLQKALQTALSEFGKLHDIGTAAILKTERLCVNNIVSQWEKLFKN